MALLDDLTKGAATPTGFAVGVGAALLAPVLAPAVSQMLRPAAKAVMRTGITLYRSAVEPVSAAISGLVTEAQLELAAASAGSAPPLAAASPESAESETPPRPHKRRGNHH